MTEAESNPKHYDGVDSLRVYAAIGIILMHVRSNGGYEVGGFFFNNIIPSFTNCVFLFMTISGFGMCCGYFDKILNYKITLEDFYAKRYAKNWPFFALLCLLDMLMSLSRDSLYEVFANLTLCFGLLPNANIGVIGVGWTLGVVFVFYLLFPFFVFLLSNKKRAWLTFIAALIFNLLCEVYFFDKDHMLEGFQARTSFIYCAVYFVSGGLLYLYKDNLSELVGKYEWYAFWSCIVSMVLYFIIGASTLTILFINISLLVYSIGESKFKRILYNPVIKFMESISFEIYLCHMVVYRVFERFDLIHVAKNNLISYCLVATGTICGTIIFSLCSRWLLHGINRLCHVKGERELEGKEKCSKN